MSSDGRLPSTGEGSRKYPASYVRCPPTPGGREKPANPSEDTSQSIEAGEGACGQEEAQLRGLPEVLTLRAFVQDKGPEGGKISFRIVVLQACTTRFGSSEKVLRRV